MLLSYPQIYCIHQGRSVKSSHCTRFDYSPDYGVSPLLPKSATTKFVYSIPLPKNVHLASPVCLSLMTTTLSFSHVLLLPDATIFGNMF